MTKLKLTGVLLSVLAGACLASHRAKLRRDSGNANGNRDIRSDNASSAPRQAGTSVDAGGQTA